MAALVMQALNDRGIAAWMPDSNADYGLAWLRLGIPCLS